MDMLTDVHDFHHGTNGRRYLNAFAEQFAGSIQSPDGKDWKRGPGAAQETADELVRGCSLALEECEPMYVASEMCELIEYAAPKMRMEPMRASDLITGDGFAYFDKPLTLIDRRGKQLYIRCMQWNVSYIDRDPRRAHVTMGTEQTDEQVILLALYASSIDNPQEYDPRGGTIERLPLLAHVAIIPLEDQALDPRDIREDLGAQGQLEKSFLTLMRLCQQQIAVKGTARLNRAVWKRSAWRQIREMVVFTLRRAKQEHHGDESNTVEWSHRWFVSGHWRNQPYKENGETVYRQIWIAPYVKGPDGKPLIFKRRAFELVR